MPARCEKSRNRGLPGDTPTPGRRYVALAGGGEDHGRKGKRTHQSPARGRLPGWWQDHPAPAFDFFGGPLEHHGHRQRVRRPGDRRIPPSGDSSDVVELTSGCICCTLVLDLERTLLAVPERFSPRRIFIEAPGVADPQGIRSAPGFKGLRGRVSLYRAVTVLDVKLWRARPMLGRVFWAPNASPGFSTPCLSGFSASRAGSDSPKKRASATTWGGRPAGPTWETLGTRNWPSWPGTRTPGPCWNGWSRAGSGLRFPNPPSPESGSRKRRRTHSRRKARFPASAPDRFWHLPPDSRRPDSAVVSSPHS